jgi:hypothetical protein
MTTPDLDRLVWVDDPDTDHAYRCTVAALVDDNNGDAEIVTALEALLSGRVAWTTVGGGAAPLTILCLAKEA